MEPIEKDWFNKMLEARNITIDGRPLYAYRITSQEYRALQDILTTRCKENLSLNELLEEFGFSVLFVFFATEWYKREYNGSFWKWDSIFTNFTKKTLRNVNVRGDAVERALKFLQREIPANAAGKKYFGAIIANGGLPAKYIQNKQSSLEGLITAALKYKLRYVVSRDELMEYVEDRADSYKLAESLKIEDMYQLIVDVVEKVVDLKNRYNLNLKSGVITKLDACNPEWREEFPILLEDDAIRTLLNRLIKDASETKVAEKRPFVKRFLNGNPDELFLDLEIVFPSKPVERDYFQRYFDIKEDVPRVFYLNTWDSNKTKIAKIEADLFQPDVYSIATYSNKIPVTESVILETFSPTNDKNINGFKVRLAESVDLSEPLVFITDEKGKYLYVGSGNVGVATSICYIGLPADGVVPKDVELANTFMVDGHKFNLYKCEGKNAIIGEYEIRLNDTTKNKQYVLGGRLLQYRTKPYDAYMDLPQLYYIDEEQNYIREQEIAYYKHNSDVVLTKTECRGLVDVCCYKNKKRVCKIPAFVLPDETAFEYKNVTSNSGDIKIKNFTPDRIVPVSSNKYSAVVTNNTISFKSLTEMPPSTVGFGIWFSDNQGHVDIEMPFPAKGFGFYDENLENINNSVISLNNLHGKRINIFGLPEGCYLRLSSDTQVIDKTLTTNNAFAEYRLIDYEKDIRFLFNDNTEDVTLALDGSSRPARLRVARYDITTEFHDNNFFAIAKTDVIPSSVTLSAIDLLKSGSKPVCLNITPEGIVDTASLDTGIYIIYTDASSVFSIKPFVYRTMSNFETNDFYRFIILEDVKKLRQVLLSELASDYNSKIWEDVNRLSELFISNDIPLDAINLWTAIAEDPGLLMLYLLRGTFITPFLNNSSSLSEAIELASNLIDTQYINITKMLYKLRDELLINTALLPKYLISDIVEKYKVFFNQTLDKMFENLDQGTCDSKTREQFNNLKYKIWDKQYSIIATVFKEMSFVLCTLMYSEADCMRVLQQSNESNGVLINNIHDYAKKSKTASDWSDDLFGKINQMLNAYVSEITGGYDGIKIPAEVSINITKICSNIGSPLFKFEQYPEVRSGVIHFPMFCAWLSNQRQDMYLIDTVLINTVRNFIRFHLNYFVEAYRISTIILSKV